MTDQPNLGTVTKEERDKFYEDSGCVPTTCARALGLPRVRWLQREDNASPFRNVIELGCHDGFSTRWLLNSPHLERLVGVELSADAVMHAKHLQQGKIFPELGNYILGDIFELEGGYHDETGKIFFDTVVCFELIEHFPEETSERLLRLVYSLMAPGGRAFLTTPHIDGPFGKSNPDPAHIHFFDEESLEAWIVRETGCVATVTNIQGILHATWQKDSIDGEETNQDQEGSGEPNQGTEDSEGREDQREATDGQTETVLRQAGRWSEDSAPDLNPIMMQRVLTRIEERLCALEALSHPPVVTYKADDLDAMLDRLSNRLSDLEAHSFPND